MIYHSLLSRIRQLELLLPAIVGLLAERFGVLVGVGFLGTAPLLILLLAPWRAREEA